jgi:hypothetical protein
MILAVVAAAEEGKEEEGCLNAAACSVLLFTGSWWVVMQFNSVFTVGYFDVLQQ